MGQTLPVNRNGCPTLCQPQRKTLLSRGSVFHKAAVFGFIASDELAVFVVEGDRQLYLVAQLHNVLHQFVGFFNHSVIAR